VRGLGAGTVEYNRCLVHGGPTTGAHRGYLQRKKGASWTSLSIAQGGGATDATGQ
jgi:hypothetical protein